jgi:hypothetical protein
MVRSPHTCTVLATGPTRTDARKLVAAPRCEYAVPRTITSVTGFNPGNRSESATRRSAAALSEAVYSASPTIGGASARGSARAPGRME